MLFSVLNTVFHTRAMNALEAAEASNVERFVLISADKMVRPAHVMGATKRFAELCIQNIAVRTNLGTILPMERFANARGSYSSEVRLLRWQVKGACHGNVTRD